jgi:hypothetical protein
MNAADVTDTFSNYSKLPILLPRYGKADLQPRFRQ